MAKKERILKSTLWVTAVIILSKGFGFVRDMVTTARFGLSFENDAYVSAYSLFYLPVLLFNSCISATMIPLYLEAKAKKGIRRANRFAGNAVNLFAAAALAITAILFAFSRPLTHLVYSGFPAEKLDCTVQLFRIMLLGLVFNITSISLASLLNAAEKYIAAQLTGFPLSLCVIAASLLFADRFGIAAVAWGVFAANLLQMLILIPFLRGWFRCRLDFNFRDRRFRRLLRLAVPAMLSMGISELNHMIDHALASGLREGTLTAMTAAYRLVTFLQGILVVPLTTVMFSKMSRRAAEGDERGALSLLMDSMMQLAVVVLPVVVIGVILSGDVIRFAYLRGRFTANDVTVTAGVLSFYLIGIPAFAMRDFLSRMFHALKDTKTPFRVSIVVVATNVTLNIILRRLMGANGLALATSVAGYVGTVLLLVLLHGRFGHIGFGRVAGQLLRILAATALCAGCCIVMDRVVPPVSGMHMVFLRLALCGGASMIVYAAGCLILRVGSFRQMIRDIRR